MRIEAKGLCVLLVLLGAASGCRVHESVPSARLQTHPLRERAEQAWLAGRRDEALRLWRGYADGFASGDELAAARYWEGLILLERGEVEPARTALRLARAAADSPRLRADVAIALGDSALALDRFDEAIARYQEALDLHAPGARNAYALFRLGQARQRSGDWGAGRSHLELVLERYPDSPVARLARERLGFPVHGFHVAVASFDDPDRAAELERELERRGYPARRVHDANGATPWRVWVGPYASYADASAAQAELGAALERRLEILP